MLYWRVTAYGRRYTSINLNISQDPNREDYGRKFIVILHKNE